VRSEEEFVHVSLVLSFHFLVFGCQIRGDASFSAAAQICFCPVKRKAVWKPASFFSALHARL
jgi:hypothetical protein